MLTLANVLALALIVADEPASAKAPVVSGGSNGTTTIKDGALTITFTPVEPGGPSKAPSAVFLGEFKPQEAWPLTLPDAIRIGLDNSEVVRVIRLGGEPGPTTPDNVARRFATPEGQGADIVIARLNADASVWNFQAAVMAHVRSIEQQYWALSHQQVVLWSREIAVRLGEEILKRERAELYASRATQLYASRATQADVAEAEQQLENFKLNLVTATSDVITTEKQLRNMLGLPAADDRRIVPATAPTEAKVDPAWEESVAAMNASQPDLAIQRQFVATAEFKAILEGENPALSPERREASKLALEKQQAFLRQILHQTTHSLARFFLQVDATYKQFQTAQRLRAAAQNRLEAQRAFFEEGRVTIDRLLDAVGQYSNAIAQESEYKFTYNTSIAALEEAKGTLLARDKITVAEGPTPRKAYLQAEDRQVAPASYQPPAKAVPLANPQPAPMMYKLKAKLGCVKLLEIEVEVSPASPPSRD